MHFTSYFIPLFAAPLLASAALSPPSPTSVSNAQNHHIMKPMVGRSSANILARSPRPDDDCDSDEKKCGGECVPDSYVCCPDNVSGGCPKDDECQKSSGHWGCCPEGKRCSWDDDDDDDHDNDHDHDDDDDESFLDKVGDFGDDVKDDWDDIRDNEGANVKPELVSIVALASFAALAGAV